MADNFDFTEGSGKTGAADDVSGVLFAKVKLDLGTDGISAPALAGAGAVATGVQRVTLASDDPAVVDLAAIEVLLGTIDADTGAIKTAVELMDNAISGNEMQVDVVAALPAGTNAIGKLVANSGVDIGDVTLTAGTAAIGKLAANTGIDIGDVDVISVVPGVAATNLGKAEDAAHSSGDVGVAAMTVRANSAVSLSGADNDYQPLITDTNGRLHVIEANSATIDADTGAIKLATEIMDDWDATHASAAPADGAQVMGAAYSTALPTDVGADADAARLVTDRYGRLCTGLQPQAAKATLDNADTTTAREVVAAVASRKIYVTSLILSVDTAGNYWLEDGDATQVTGKFYLAANGGVAITFPEGTPLNTVTVNKALLAKGSTSGNVSVTVTYYLAV